MNETYSIAIFYLFFKQEKFDWKMSFKFAGLTNVWIHIVQMYVIFIHLKLWVAAARHNFKWVKN